MLGLLFSCRSFESSAFHSAAVQAASGPPLFFWMIRLFVYSSMPHGWTLLDADVSYPLLFSFSLSFSLTFQTDIRTRVSMSTSASTVCSRLLYLISIERLVLVRLFTTVVLLLSFFLSFSFLSDFYWEKLENRVVSTLIRRLGCVLQPRKLCWNQQAAQSVSVCEENDQLTTQYRTDRGGVQS